MQLPPAGWMQHIPQRDCATASDALCFCEALWNIELALYHTTTYITTQPLSHVTG